MRLPFEGRVVSRIEEHLAELGVGRPGRRGILRHALGWLGKAVGGVTALGGESAILTRIRAEEWRGAERYSREVEWPGWSVAERDTLEGHSCDQRFQNHWAEDVARGREGKPPRSVR